MTTEAVMTSPKPFTRGYNSTPMDHIVDPGCTASIHAYRRAHQQGCKCPGPSYDSYRAYHADYADRKRAEQGRVKRELPTLTEDLPGEEWRVVPDYPEYRVSSLGRIESIKRTTVDSAGRPRPFGGHLLSPTVHRTGYLRIVLRVPIDGVKRRRYEFVHRIVLQAFRGPCPDGMQACHGNGERLDNRLANLRWDTIKANAEDRVRHGTGRKEQCPRGHLLEFPNLAVHKTSGGVRRRCRACYKADLRIRRVYKSIPTSVPDLYQQLSDRYYEQFMRAATASAELVAAVRKENE